MLKKFALFGAAACLAVSGSASAQGLYIGAGVGGTGLMNQVSNYSNSLTLPFDVTSTHAGLNTGSANFAKTGFSGDVFAGYVFCVGNGFVLAPELKGSFTNTKQNDSITAGGTITVPGYAPVTLSDTDTFSQKVSGSFNVSLRPGYYVTDNTMIYGRVGYSWTKFNTTYTDSLSTVSLNNSKTRGGWAVGGGIEVNLTGQLGLRGDYVYTRYSNFTMTNSVNQSATFKPSTNSLTVGLVYTIGNAMQLGA